MKGELPNKRRTAAGAAAAARTFEHRIARSLAAMLRNMNDSRRAPRLDGRDRFPTVIYRAAR